MIRFSALLMFLFFLPGPAMAQMPAEWKNCAQDSDCRIVGGGCFLDAVNGAYITQGTQYANDINARIECIRYIDPLLARAVCNIMPEPECGLAGNCPAPQGQCAAVE